MMASDLRIIERITFTAPLGLRFWDIRLDAPVGPGLNVVASPESNTQRQTAAVANTSGTYVFHHLPGLRALEAGSGDAAYWSGLTDARSFLIQVDDPFGRFLPFSFVAEAPHRGIYAFACDSPLSSPPDALASVPAYSTATRAPAPGMAVLRAELQDTLTRAPAAWAVVEARIGTLPPVRAIADAAGRVALVFAYPEPVGFPTGSPLRGSGPALINQTWTVQLSAAYTPAASVSDAPNLCVTLAQDPAHLWGDAAQTEPLTHVTLQFGRELVIRSGMLPSLLITPVPA